MTAYLRPGEGWLKWLYTGVGIYTAAVATTMLYFSGRQMLPPVRVGACRFDDLAEVYDEQLGWDEFMMGLNWIRGWYVGRAYGKVLEISGGTGRNYKFYDYDKISSLTVTDNSYPMLREAKDKYEQFNNSRYYKITTPVHFKLSDAQDLCIQEEVAQNLTVTDKSIATRFKEWFQKSPSTQDEGAVTQNEAVVTQSNKFSLATEMSALQQLQQFEAHEFDCVVDTFGLCSHEDPIAALHQVQKVCKPHGRVILIEHGLSTWKWLNNRLDQDAEKHKHKWGCWWNRDIGRIVSEAGLVVEYEERYHFGSTHVFICRPKQEQKKIRGQEHVVKSEFWQQ
eukprot:TRINITY_DN1139_c1_g2_i2.p1 TRINITY_DN1139_c1_g2~~TRINITY_DN1139_c1_g2_i2.p1  ORF type:complete len:353 (+),score=41.14 TRINITY_DN1139_c1_g2_i2:51-1061(+)